MKADKEFRDLWHHYIGLAGPDFSALLVRRLEMAFYAGAASHIAMLNTIVDFPPNDARRLARDLADHVMGTLDVLLEDNPKREGPNPEDN